jgi:hypothetical protein
MVVMPIMLNGKAADQTPPNDNITLVTYSFTTKCTSLILDHVLDPETHKKKSF